MASLEFPSNPTNGQTYTLNGVTYYYNSTVGGWLTQLTSMNLSTSSNTQVLFNDAGLANGSSGLVFDKGSGNLGIGTTNPVTTLHISDGNTSISSVLYTSDFQTISAQGTAPGFNIIAAANTAAGRGVFKATRARGTLSSPLVPILNDNTFSLLGTIYDGTTGRATAGINMDVDGTVSDNVAPQRISFWTGLTNTRTEKMRITGSGDVGIGTTSPTCKLHLVTGGSSAVSVANRGILVTNDVGARLVLETTTAPANTKNFVLRSENGIFSVATLNDTGTAWVTDNAFNIAANGNIGIGITPTTRNNTRLQLIDGIGFPATQVASSDANTLDDYEEGTFNPTITSSLTVPTSISYTYQRGAYVKIGKMVYVSITVGATWNNSPTGQIQITLPFTVNDPAIAYSCAYLGYYNSAFSFGAGRTQLMGEFYSGGGAIMQLVAGGSGVAPSYVTYSGGAATVANGFFIESAGVYQTAN